jgi:hypothetical protein
MFRSKVLPGSHLIAVTRAASGCFLFKRFRPLEKKGYQTFGVAIKFYQQLLFCRFQNLAGLNSRDLLMANRPQTKTSLLKMLL